MAELTCLERVESACESRMSDLWTLMYPKPDDVELSDDGTLDTVLSIGPVEYRCTDAADYRDDNGELDLAALVDDEWSWIEDEIRVAFNEYALSFDYVEPDTFDDQERGYFRYQISYGGPSEEIRFFVDENKNPYEIQFWFMDWFDGAFVHLRGDNRDLMNDLFQWYVG